MDEDRLVSPISIDVAKKAIEKRFPEIQVKTISYLGGGSHSAFAVNDTFVLRFPKLVENVASVEEMRALFQSEKQLLDAIRQAVTPIEIPTQTFLFTNPLPDFPAPVAGYPLLRGEQVVHLLNQDSNANLATLLGAFLKQLHSINPQQLPASHAGRPTVEDLQDSWFQNYEYIRAHLFPLLDSNERAWTENTYETFLNHAYERTPAIVFNHGDFGAENVLFDTASNRLSVIDFDDAGFGDSVGDFTLWLDYGHMFVQEMLKGYGCATDERFMARAQFYYNRIPFIYFDLGRKTENDHFIAFGKDLLATRMKGKKDD